MASISSSGVPAYFRQSYTSSAGSFETFYTCPAGIMSIVTIDSVFRTSQFTIRFNSSDSNASFSTDIYNNPSVSTTTRTPFPNLTLPEAKMFQPVWNGSVVTSNQIILMPGEFLSLFQSTTNAGAAIVSISIQEYAQP